MRLQGTLSDRRCLRRAVSSVLSSTTGSTVVGNRSWEVIPLSDLWVAPPQNGQTTLTTLVVSSRQYCCWQPWLLPSDCLSSGGTKLSGCVNTLSGEQSTSLIFLPSAVDSTIAEVQPPPPKLGLVFGVETRKTRPKGA